MEFGHFAMATGAARFGKGGELGSNWKAWHGAPVEVGNLDSPAVAEMDEHASMEEVAMIDEEG